MGKDSKWWMLVDTAGRDSSLTNGGVVPVAGSLRQGRELGVVPGWGGYKKGRQWYVVNEQPLLLRSIRSIWR